MHVDEHLAIVSQVLGADVVAGHAAQGDFIDAGIDRLDIRRVFLDPLGLHPRGGLFPCRDIVRRRKGRERYRRVFEQAHEGPHLWRYPFRNIDKRRHRRRLSVRRAADGRTEVRRDDLMNSGLDGYGAIQIFHLGPPLFSMKAVIEILHRQSAVF
ncbi:hypothetical protein D3C85_1280390 [compost metagenome]